MRILLAPDKFASSVAAAQVESRQGRTSTNLILFLREFATDQLFIALFLETCGSLVCSEVVWGHYNFSRGSRDLHQATQRSALVLPSTLGAHTRLQYTVKLGNIAVLIRSFAILEPTRQPRSSISSEISTCIVEG